MEVIKVGRVKSLECMHANKMIVKSSSDSYHVHAALGHTTKSGYLYTLIEQSLTFNIVDPVTYYAKYNCIPKEISEERINLYCLPTCLL